MRIKIYKGPWKDMYDWSEIGTGGDSLALVNVSTEKVAEWMAVMARHHQMQDELEALAAGQEVGFTGRIRLDPTALLLSMKNVDDEVRALAVACELHLASERKRPSWWRFWRRG